MKKIKNCILTGLVAVVFAAGCQNTSMNRTNQGAMNGAVAGGVVGGIAGHNINRLVSSSHTFSHKTAEGIVGGTVLGGVIGALVGYAQDQKARADQVTAAGAGE